jgi:hypothetical protein
MHDGETGEGTPVHREETIMENRKCPMCQCEQFYKASFASPISLSLSFWKATLMHGLVCLDCGFVAPHVGRAGLEAIRTKARKEGIVFDESPGKEELREL